MKKYMLISGFFILLFISCEEKESATAQMLLGKKIFHDPTLSVGDTLACMHCHPYGNVDRKKWSMGFKDGSGRSRKWDTPTLWGIEKTGPYLLDGSKSDLKETIRYFVNYMGKVGEDGGKPPISDEDLEALTLFTASYAVPNNPYLNGDGTMTDLQRKGKLVFKDKNRGNCTQCHFGETFTDNKDYQIENGVRIETPSLLSLWDTDPYWHDGRFKTLSDLLDGHFNSNRLKARTEAPLAEDEKRALVAYLNAL